MKNTIFDPVALKDIITWAGYEPKIVKKIFELIADILNILLKDLASRRD